jgi:hypothetical protein
MDTTLPGLMFMHTPEPMSMRIHANITAPIITPIDWEVKHNQRLETDILVHERLITL